MRTVAACVHSLREIGIDQWDEEYPSVEVIESAIDSRALYVVVKADDVAAAVGLDSNEPEEYGTCSWQFGSPALVVHHLLVHPNHWRIGLASRLMDFAEALAVRKGLLSIRLDAYTGNPAALSLYRGRGYSEAGQVVFPRRGLAFKCFEKQV